MSRLLEELRTYVPNKNKHDIVEAKAAHIIASAIHLLEYINQNYSEEDAENLSKRFLSSIRGADPERFIRATRRIKNGDKLDDNE